MSDDDILWLVEYTAKVQAVAAKQAALAAAREERAAIVAWLRERHIGVGAWAAADDIERGEHLEAADE
ncbi:MAG: hypothetical protein QM286_05970 [Acidobacteriota bacterium]|nr:hypothetical protein [Acidobacteriota bacterium]